ncbi:hypothetical protein DFH07DRAFT_820773 [Mycena maculata]|uniref:Uncharacterized protein n=1 Tax=Mycena maculata TaxID=230809 RepID=A0AAD7J832_9AGAR|nr:hypothetical protein DFH07DRAFT_863573 [Mycena maculata]KAJ7755368.1 hypothetical protein DFH07DRAFT_822053 [Mycena maculata]KAJ7756493.1 hypothetical protein DFH07DRAFT_820769 [Mycena maculata]KAJ7756495.1 hypothetical protein DFH07DRAFT_820773 [Mycena maculata]
MIEDPARYVQSSGFAGLRPAKIRVIFKLPLQFGSYPHPLAYIEWLTPLNGRPDPVSGMFTTHRSTPDPPPAPQCCCYLLGAHRPQLSFNGQERYSN